MLAHGFRGSVHGLLITKQTHHSGRAWRRKATQLKVAEELGRKGSWAR